MFSSPEKMGLLDPATSDGRVIFFLPWQSKSAGMSSLGFIWCALVGRSVCFVGRSVWSIGRSDWSVGRIGRTVGRSVGRFGRTVGRIRLSVGRSVWSVDRSVNLVFACLLFGWLVGCSTCCLCWFVSLPVLFLDMTIAGTTDTPTKVSFSPHPNEAEIQFILNEIKHYLDKDIQGGVDRCC